MNEKGLNFDKLIAYYRERDKIGDKRRKGDIILLSVFLVLVIGLYALYILFSL